MKTPTVHRPCRPRFFWLHNKKERQIIRFNALFECTSRTHIRTFLRFHGFPESDRLCTFLIIKGNKYLIIVP